jgi:hypothetical protein
MSSYPAKWYRDLSRNHGLRLRGRALGAALTLIGLLLLGASTAEATVRTGTISFDRPPNRLSLTPEPPETQQHEYPQAVTVSYDDQTGAISGHIQIYDAASWSDYRGLGQLFLGPACGPDTFPRELAVRFSYDTDNGPRRYPPWRRL